MDNPFIERQKLYKRIIDACYKEPISITLADVSQHVDHLSFVLKHSSNENTGYDPFDSDDSDEKEVFMISDNDYDISFFFSSDEVAEHFQRMEMDHHTIICVNYANQLAPQKIHLDNCFRFYPISKEVFTNLGLGFILTDSYISRQRFINPNFVKLLPEDQVQFML
jgi:hypothetical protein